jgi:hypothetical protein
MINGAHAVLYSDDADATRATLAKVLGTRSVDAGGGWLIFALPPAEIAVHPAEEGGRAKLYLLCDDVAATVTAFQAEGIEVARPIGDQGLGPAHCHHPPRRGRARPLPAAPPDRGPAELSSAQPVGQGRRAPLQPWPPACSTPPWPGSGDYQAARRSGQPDSCPCTRTRLLSRSRSSTLIDSASPARAAVSYSNGHSAFSHTPTSSRRHSR